MAPIEVSIWAGIIAGCLLVGLVIFIVLWRGANSIQGNDLVMVALAAVLILGSQFSDITVFHLLRFKKEVNALIEKQVSLSEEKLAHSLEARLTDSLEEPRIRIDALSKKFGYSLDRLENLKIQLERTQEKLESLSKKPDFYEPETSPGTIPEKHPISPERKRPFQEETPKTKPEVTPKPKPEREFKPKPEISPLMR